MLENDRLRAVLDKGTGRIRSLQIDGMELLESSAGFSLVETEPATSNAWQIGRHIRQIPVDQCVDLRWTERGPLRQSVQAKYLIASSTLEVTYLLEEGSDTLRLNVKTDWHEIGGATIPVLFFQVPLKYQPIHFRYDVAAGSVCRESTANDVPGLQYGLAAQRAWCRSDDDERLQVRLPWRGFHAGVDAAQQLHQAPIPTRNGESISLSSA